jgi:hypothetical protein
MANPLLVSTELADRRTGQCPYRSTRNRSNASRKRTYTCTNRRTSTCVAKDATTLFLLVVLRKHLIEERMGTFSGCVVLLKNIHDHPVLRMNWIFLRGIFPGSG